MFEELILQKNFFVNSFSKISLITTTIEINENND